MPEIHCDIVDCLYNDAKLKCTYKGEVNLIHHWMPEYPGGHFQHFLKCKAYQSTNDWEVKHEESACLK